MNADSYPHGTALMNAVSHVEVLRLLLATDGIDVNAPTDWGGTALLMASEEGEAEAVRLLLAADVVPGTTTCVRRPRRCTPTVRTYLSLTNLGTKRAIFSFVTFLAFARLRHPKKPERVRTVHTHTNTLPKHIAMHGMCFSVII